MMLITKVSLLRHGLKEGFLVCRAFSSVRLAFTLTEAPNASSEAQKVPVVIAHGLFGSKQNWNSIAKALAQRLNRPIYALDLRNHGESAWNPAMNYADLCGDVVSFCKEQGLQSVHFVGHSLYVFSCMIIFMELKEL